MLCSRDPYISNQAWYFNTNTSLLEFSISVSQSSIFNEPLTGWLDHISSWIIFQLNPLIRVFQMINELQDIWCWPTSHTIWPISKNGKFSSIFWVNLQKRKCESASLFLFDNESKFVLWSNDSFKRIITTKYKCTDFWKYLLQSGHQQYYSLVPICLFSTSLRTIGSNRGSEPFPACTNSLTVISTWNQRLKGDKGHKRMSHSILTLNWGQFAVIRSKILKTARRTDEKRGNRWI